VLVAGGGLAVFLLRSGDVSDTASAAAVSSEAAPASMDAPSPPASVDAPNAGPPSPTTPPVTAGAAEPSASSRPGPVASPTTTRTAAAPSDPRPPADSDGAASRAAAERLSIAKAKLASNLHVQALDDLRQIVLDYPGSRTAADAALLSADELTKLNRVDDAMAAHVEFAGRFPSDPRVAKSRLDLAALLLKTRRSNREASAREMLGTIARDFPRTLEAQTALQRKLQLETSTRQKEKDPVLGIEAPVALPTLRTLAEQFPDAPGTMQALFRLAEIYTDLHQYERAAQALTDLATRFPANPHDAWFRLGELYERQLKDGDRARAAYAQVPGSSSRYREAQRRANRR
jgi:TolA-binding protein